MTAKKVIRAQNISIENRIPTVYLVDSAGVFLPLQEDVFPDTDDFGRVFRNNAVMSALGISQIAAIMGMCVAGGGYLPVMCDHVLMTNGSGLFLAGPALVQAAIGQKISAEELGGAAMHSAISGRVDFREPNDEACIARIRDIIEKWGYRRQSPWDRKKPVPPALAAEEIYGSYDPSPARPYDMKQILARLVVAWPTARYAVMSGDSAAGTLVEIKIKQLERTGKNLSEEERKELYESVKRSYDEQTDPRYGAARLWIDKIIDPIETRDAITQALEAAALNPDVPEFKVGVLQT